MSRRSRLEGRPSCNVSKNGIDFRSSAAFRRSSLLSSVSDYSVCATLVGPRMSLRSRTSIRKSPLPFLTCSMSPGRTSREGFTGCPLHSTLPNSHAFDASARVLKNRAAQSHLSILTRVIASIFVSVQSCQSCKLGYESNTAVKIGLLSDTHGFLHEALFSYFADCDELWHAGDFGSIEIFDRLNSFKPTRGVY